MNPKPDYEGLVQLLSTLRQLPDTDGMAILESHEADGITQLGFDAQPGPWCCPPIPAHLVAGNALLEHLADNVDAFWYPRRAAMRVDQPPGEPVIPTNGVGVVGVCHEEVPPKTVSRADSNAILEAVERAGGRIAKRLLQKKLWRIPAERFNQAIQVLVEHGEIRIEGNVLIAQPVPQPESSAFHGAPQSLESVPPTLSAIGPGESPKPVNGIRGRATKVIEDAN